MYKFLSGMVLVICMSLFTLVSVQADQVNESNEHVHFFAHIDDIIFSELSIGDIVVVPADNFSSVTIEFESFEAYKLWLGKSVTSCCAVFDYTFNSYKEFREAFPLLDDGREENQSIFADEQSLPTNSIVVDVMLPCGEMAIWTMYLNHATAYSCVVAYEIWFDSYEEFREAFPLIHNAYSIESASSCGGSYRISATNTGRCDFVFIHSTRCVNCLNFSIPVHECFGKIHNVRRDCTVCDTRTWTETHGGICGSSALDACTRC